MRSDNYRVIWNSNQENEFQNLVTSGYEPFPTWERKAKAGDPFAKKRVKWYKKALSLNFMRIARTFMNINNIAEDPACEDVRQKFKASLTIGWPIRATKELKRNEIH